MITKLENMNKDVADKIYTVFQNSYQVEAQLIGTLNFPPLSRGVKDIENSINEFYGFIVDGCLAAVVEIAMENKHLEINSLTVDPKYFRKGIASKLISFILNGFDATIITVETAVVNEPAIILYKKHGFVEFKRWTPSHGIEKIAMRIQYGN